MRHVHRVLPSLPIALSLGLLVASCGGDVRIASNSFCDGIEQPSEDGVDSPFDSDNDGYFDAANDGCAEYYEETDCDDSDAAVNPGAAEVECDGTDNDCNADTLESVDVDDDGVPSCADCDDNDADNTAEQGVDSDNDGSEACFDCDDSDPSFFPGAPEDDCTDPTDYNCDGQVAYADADGDGVAACTDCDDNDELVTAAQGVDFDNDGSEACFDCDDSDPINFPGNVEICDNRDNDCSGAADEGLNCFTDYSGNWAITPAISYACAFNFVTINVGVLSVTDAGSVIVFAGISGSQPGAMNGTVTGDAFTATNFISSGGGGCDETYDLSGTFLSTSEFTATLSATFTGGAACYDCANQSWSITGSR